MPHALPPLHLLLLLGAILGGWATTTSAKTLRIGVPAKSPYPQYVAVKCNWTSNETCFRGHAVDVFRLVWKNLYNNSDYEFIPCDGHYDTLIERVYSKELDAVVGDTSIVANRTRYIEYSRPYTETGARMVVLEKREEVKAWIFVKPFTGTLWVSTGAIFLYNGIIVWLIESTDDEEKRFSFNHIGNLIWLSFTTLFPIHGEKLRSNLSKMAMVVWLFVALILIQSYSANITSMLTFGRLRPSVVDVNSLLKDKAKVGCDKSSFMSKYLEKVGFGAGCVETYDLDEYAEALSSGATKAAFLEIPSLQIFLDENPKGFTVIGPTYEIGGFAFIFQKGSDYVQEVSDEILRLRENGTLRRLEEKSLSSSKRSSVEADHNKNDRLSLDGFWGLFVITGSMSTLALVLFLVGRLRDTWQCRTRSVGPSVELISRPNGIHNNDDQSPDLAVVELRDFKRCNTV